MGVLDRARDRRRTRTQPRVVVASGVRITRQNTDNVRRFITGKAEWQQHAWAYRDLIGELREGLQYQCRAVGRVAFMPAQINPEADEPWLFSADECTLSPELQRAAREELQRLPIDSMSWKARLAENLAVPGEVWLHGHPDPRDPDGEVWDVRSVDEIEVGMNGGFSINNGGNRPDEVDLDSDDLMRLWQPHPARFWQADSALRSLLDVCEDVVLVGKELRAAARSRIAANGILAFPDGMTLQSQRTTGPHTPGTADTFAADLTAQVTASIANEGEPGAVMPVVLTGDTDDIAAIRHITIMREDSPSLIGKLDKALARLGAGMDIPAEIITGMSDANHWTAWQIDTATFRHHIEPLVRVCGDALAEGYLREALLARDEGFDPAEVAKVCVWHDAGNLTENPNRGQDARDAFDRGAIGFDELRDALGFADGAKPDDDEFLRMIAWKAGVSPDIAAQVLALQLGAGMPLPQAQPRTIDAGPAEIDGPGQTGQGPGAGDGQDPENPVPDPPEDGVTAALVERGAELVRELVAAANSGRTFDVHEALHRELLDLERSTRQRLTAEADAAVRRAVERASSRTRSRANGARYADVRRQLAARPDELCTVVLGREATLALGVTERELLADAWEALRPRYARIVRAAIERAAGLAARILGLSGDNADAVRVRIVDTMGARVDPAWERFESTLNRSAERELFDPAAPDVEPEGELSDTIVTEGEVRAIMAEIGGILPESGGIDDTGVSAQPHPAGGITTGTAMADEFEQHGGSNLGFEFHYGITPTPRHFEPHLLMHMHRYTSWIDPELSTEDQYGGRYRWVGPYFHAGDHQNCSCDYMSLWAIPDHAEVQDENTGDDFPYMRTDRILAEDDDRQPGGGYPTGPTTAQQTRDERERIRKLQERYIRHPERR